MAYLLYPIYSDYEVKFKEKTAQFILSDDQILFQKLDLALSGDYKAMEKFGFKGLTNFVKNAYDEFQHQH